jgi:predicted DNA-binding transcriptional regulator AlpA
MSASNENEPPSLTIVHVAPSNQSEPVTAVDLIDEPALAARLGVSRSTLQSWRYTGRGPRFIKLGRMIRYRHADVDAYLRANTRGKVA